MEKKFTGIRMYAEDSHKLKVWAAEANKPVGDVIRDLVSFVEQRAEQRRQLLQNSGMGTQGQPTLNLALMADETVKSLLKKPPEGLKQGADWGSADGDDW